MKRDVLLKNFMALFKSNDAVLVGGNAFCNEVRRFTASSNILFVEDEDGLAASMSIGVALGTPKRVFVLCEDYYALRCMPALSNMGVSKCPNLFLITFASGYHPGLNNCPTIYNSLVSFKGMLFNTGFKAYGYTGHFKTVQTARSIMSSIFRNLKGPAAGVIELDPRKEHKEIKVNYKEMVEDFKDFVMEDLGTSLFNPPTNFSEAQWQNS